MGLSTNPSISECEKAFAASAIIVTMLVYLVNLILYSSRSDA